jgi:septum formation protein
VTLVLASSSAQRRTILERLGVTFVVRPPGIAEIEQGDPPSVARDNALAKATAIAVAPGDLVVGVDTIVALDGELFGKPNSAADAVRTMRALSGRTHTVLSGLALVAADAEPRVVTEATAVTFRELDDAMIEWYVATGEWRGRSGGYAIQQAGGALVRRIEGDYTNVVGLPVAALLDLHPSLLSASGPAD